MAGRGWGPELVIFDCDGVLVDSESIAVDVEVELLAKAGIEISRLEMTSRYSGLSWRDTVADMTSGSGCTVPDWLANRSDDVLDERLERDVAAIAGVAWALERLPFRRCICSNTKMPRLIMMLGKVGLLPLFEPHVFSAKDLGENRSKPKPDIFLRAAEAMGVDPDKGVVVEDSGHGVRGALAAGMRVVGFTGGSHTYPGHADRLIENGAAVTVARMEDLPAAVEALA